MTDNELLLAMSDLLDTIDACIENNLTSRRSVFR